MGIGAVDQAGHTATFSGSQQFPRKVDPNKPDCVAPGVGIISAKPGGGCHLTRVEAGRATWAIRPLDLGIPRHFVPLRYVSSRGIEWA